MADTTAIGIIETQGLAASIEAADAMVKSARVTVLGREFAGGGLVSVVVRGDVAAVKSATDAGAAAAARVAEVVAVHLIPNPSPQTAQLLIREQHLAGSAPEGDAA
jgi:ethanolamine utilization protein EutM